MKENKPIEVIPTMRFDTFAATKALDSRSLVSMIGAWARFSCFRKQIPRKKLMNTSIPARIIETAEGLSPTRFSPRRSNKRELLMSPMPIKSTRGRVIFLDFLRSIIVRQIKAAPMGTLM